MCGYIRTSLNLPVSINNEMMAIVKRSGVQKSLYIRRAIRELNEREANNYIGGFLESLSDKQIESLKNEIKKREL